MASKLEILEALQFAHIHDRDPINTTESRRETITWQYAGTSAPGDLPTSTIYSGWAEFAATEKAAFESVLTHIETFLNVDFVETAGHVDPDLNVGKVTIPGVFTGWGGNWIRFIGSEIIQWDGFVLFDNTLDLSGTAQVNLMLHELGHALGLKHPFDSPALPADKENNKYTVMSYNNNPDNDQFSDVMMLYDVYALQDIWGEAAHLTGNTIYTGSRTDTVDTIWDTGGTDTLNARAISSPVRLDLREGEFSTFGAYPDVVIAYGTRIENATGGSGADTIIGNGLANILRGGGGADSISAGGRGDQIRGGSGSDTLMGQAGRDKIWGNAGHDTLMGQNHNDTLRGGGGHDRLEGGRGRDVLNGQNGNDTLIGNQGSDRFVFTRNSDQDRIIDFQDNLDKIRITGQGSQGEIIANGSQVGNDVVFDFGTGNILTVLNTTIAQVSDDILT